MIENDHQKKITSDWSARFESSVAKIRAAPLGDGSPILRRAEIDALESQILTFKEELAEYEKRRKIK